MTPAAEPDDPLAPVLGKLAHDFNNLLGLVVGNLSMLCEELVAQPDTAELARDALDGALQAARLTERLQTAAGRRPQFPEPLDLEAALPALAAACAETVGPAVAVRCEVTPGLRAAWVDPAMLEQVIAELAANAHAAMPEGGTLVLMATDAAGPDDGLMLTVRDDGTGMPPEIRAQAFDLFFTTRRGARGAGLGLPMVQRLVRQAGGDMILDSEPGAGTAVRLHLPSAPLA